MKRILFGFVLGFVLSHIQGVRAQDAHVEHDLTARELVEIVADYDIKHVDQQPFFMPAFGATSFDSNPPTIWLFNTGDTQSRRSTVIHEALHVHYHQRMLNPPEEFIDAEELRLYRKFFYE